MNVNQALMLRKLGLSDRVEIDFAVDRLRLKEVVRLDQVEQHEPDIADQPKTNGPLASTKISRDLLAIANEDGYINLLNIRELKNVGLWLGHGNAIFDIKSANDQKTLFTASGDATIKHWDIESKRELLTLSPHFSTIKSITIYDNNVLASGSRDGSIKIHDIRKKEPTIMCIRDAHRNKTFHKPRKASVKTDPISCVTAVTFDPMFPMIYSAGANDATIKLWDLRFSPTRPNKPTRSRDGEMFINSPLTQVHHPMTGYHCGYSQISVSSGRIFAACSDNKIYCYNNFGLPEEPVKFTGGRFNPYLRLAVIDQRFLFCGAKEGGAFMWSLRNENSSKYYPEMTKMPIGQLKPDNKDRYDTNVIETDWDSLSVITVRDDRLVCKWTMQHVSEAERKKLLEPDALATLEDDVTIEMSDIINVNVLRPSHRINNTQMISQ